MTFEERCMAHYSRVGTRLGKYPAKRPIVIPEPREKSVIKGKGNPRHAYDVEAIKRAFLGGMTRVAIAKRYDIPIKTMANFINNRRHKWEAERA